MNCTAFRQQLDRDERERSTVELLPAMKTHLDGCPACRAHLQVHYRMLEVLARDTAPALSPNFTEKILAEIEATPARHFAKPSFSWNKAAVYAGGACLLILALWLTFQNFESMLHDRQWIRFLGLQEIQNLFEKVKKVEWVQSFQSLFTSLFSFIPTTKTLIEKTLGSEVLPQTKRLFMILLMTYVIAKAAVMIEGWVRQISRRSL
jgi:hypothetical protein